MVFRLSRPQPYQASGSIHGTRIRPNVEMDLSDEYKTLQTLNAAYNIFDIDMKIERLKVSNKMEQMRNSGTHLIRVTDKVRRMREKVERDNRNTAENELTDEEKSEIGCRVNICAKVAEMLWKNLQHASVAENWNSLRVSIYTHCHADWKLDWKPPSEVSPQQCKEESIENEVSSQQCEEEVIKIEPIPYPFEEMIQVCPPVLPFEGDDETQELSIRRIEQHPNIPDDQLDNVIKEEPTPVEQIVIHVRPPRVNFDGTDNYQVNTTRKKNKHRANGHDFVEKGIKEETLDGKPEEEPTQQCSEGFFDFEPVPDLVEKMIHVSLPLLNFEGDGKHEESSRYQMKQKNSNPHDISEKVIKEEPILEEESHESMPTEYREVKQEEEDEEFEEEL